MADPVNNSTTLIPATRTLSPLQTQMNNIKGLLERSKNAIASRLPKHLTPDRMLKVALTAINKTPKLLECTQESLMMSIMQAAELGLEPGGALGEGYLVPYGNQCQFIPGYRGLIALARRSGQIISIEAHVVHEKDAFDCGLGLDPFLRHTPAWEEEDPGALRFVYAVAKLKDGGVQFEVMSNAQIKAIQAKSKAGRSGPWVDHFDEMARKTVVRRLFKYLPVSVEMASALEVQAAAESGDFSGLIEGELVSTTQTIADGQPEKPKDPPPATGAQRLQGLAKAKEAPASAPEQPTGTNPDDKAPRDPGPEDDLPWPDEDRA